MLSSAGATGPRRGVGRLLPATDPAAYVLLARRERLAWVQLVMGVVVYMAAASAAVVAGIVVGLVNGTQSPELIDVSALTSDPMALSTMAVLTAVLMPVGYWGLVRLVGGRRVPEFGLKGDARELATGLAWGAGLMCAVVAVLWAVGAYRVTDVGWDEGIVLGLAVGVQAGFAEEILFRGILLRLLEGWLGTWWALAITATVFGLIHLTNSEATLWGAVSIVLEAGILLGACYLLTRRLWFVIGVHDAWNFVQGGIFGSDVSGTGTGRGLFEASFPGPDWLTGGQMGIEGSVVTVLVCLTAGVVLTLAVRRRGLVVPPQRRR